MDGVFACPKCGYELKAKGLAAGRMVRCDWCESRVEVPFLPRVAPAAAKRRKSRRPPPWLLALWAGVSVLAVVVLTLVAANWMHARANLIHEKRVSGLLRSAESDEQAGRLGDAVAELEAALALLREMGPASSARVAELSARRDALTRREVRQRLDALTEASPDEAIGECLNLLARVKDLPALADLEATIRARLEAAAVVSASADLSAARAGLDAGRLADAFQRCERVARTIEHVGGQEHRRIHDEANALVTRIARQAGTVLDPVRGDFTFGTPSSYATALEPMLVDVLRQHGYLTCPQTSPWRASWEAASPFRLAVVIEEQMGEDYLQSRNRISRLSATVTLRNKDATLWHQLASARTQVPVPRVPAYHAARIGVGDAPVAEYERVLYDNARESFRARFSGALATIPDRTRFAPALPPDDAPRKPPSGSNAS
jgi:hypothetical protein